MTIDVKTFQKRFGEPNLLRLTNGVTYKSWTVARLTYDEIIPKVKNNTITRFKDLVLKRTNNITLIINKKRERIAVITIQQLFSFSQL